MSISIPIGGLPGNKSRSEISEKVRAALQIKADKVGGLRPAETMKAMVVTEASAVSIKIKMIKVSNLVESFRCTVKTEDEIPCLNSSIKRFRASLSPASMIFSESVQRT